LNVGASLFEIAMLHSIDGVVNTELCRTKRLMEVFMWLPVPDRNPSKNWELPGS